jgi:hypothetical protein
LRLLLTYLICSLPAWLAGQTEWLNTSLALPSLNPAFAVSSHAYNRLNALYTHDGYSSIQGQLNANSIYSAFGGEVNYKDAHHYALGIRAAYHTYFTRNNYHLLIGAQPVLSKSEQSFDTHFRVGLVLSSSEHGKWLIGLSTWINEPTIRFSDYTMIKRRWYSAQLGTALLRLNRRSVLTLLSTCNYSPETDESKALLQPLVWIKCNHSRFGALALGWRSLSSNNNDLLFRYQFTYIVTMAASYAYRLSKPNDSSNNLIELSLSYKFKFQ